MGTHQTGRDAVHLQKELRPPKLYSQKISALSAPLRFKLALIPILINDSMNTVHQLDLMEIDE